MIIDKAHRSGFGTWQEILQHFGGAIHLGMTATPKRTDNVDTYAYFCPEEPEESSMVLRPPAYAPLKASPPATKCEW